MSLSKHVRERLSAIEENKIAITVPIPKILEVCKVTYKNAISIEIIHHLLGGENMEYNVMELENSHECLAYCRQDLLENLKNDKREILFFEDRKNSTSEVMICLVKQPKTKSKREHLVLLSVLRMTIMIEPKVAVMRYFEITGKSCFVNISSIFESFQKWTMGYSCPILTLDFW